MDTTFVNSQGRVTILRRVREQFGIRQGSWIEFLPVGNRVELRIASAPTGPADGGLGILKPNPDGRRWFARPRIR